MNCGICQSSEADAYTRVKPDNELFDVIKTLSPNYVHNPMHSIYCCQKCIHLAEKKLCANDMTNLSDDTLSCLMASISNNSSDGYTDENDQAIPANGCPQGQIKKPADRTNRPCPKSRKKPLAPLQLDSIPESSSVQHGSSQQETSSSQRAAVSPQPNSPTEFLLLIGEADSSVEEHQSSTDDERTTRPVLESSMSLPSKDLANQQASSSRKRKSNALHERDSDVSNVSKRQTGGHVTTRSATKRKSPARRDYHVPNPPEALPGPTAPAVKVPRLRDLKNFFSGRQIDVNKYARSLGG